MSAPLKHTTKLHIAVPVAGLFAAFWFFVLVIFIIDFHIYQVIGALITFISLLLWIVARAQLGDAPAYGRFVTTGLYNEIRHPIYTFQTTAAIGFAIFLWISPLWVLVGTLTAFEIFRMRREEKRLLRKYGRRYQHYVQRTPF